MQSVCDIEPPLFYCTFYLLLEAVSVTDRMQNNIGALQINRAYVKFHIHWATVKLQNFYSWKCSAYIILKNCAHRLKIILLYLKKITFFNSFPILCCLYQDVNVLLQFSCNSSYPLAWVSMNTSGLLKRSFSSHCFQIDWQNYLISHW